MTEVCRQNAGVQTANRVELDGVSFSYGKNRVVRGVSLSAAAKEIIGIVGPNGAGKSTLIKLMAGTLSPDAGSVRLCGMPSNRMRPIDRAKVVAMVPQESRIPFSYRSIEVVLSGRAPHLPAFGFESDADLAIAREAMSEIDCSSFEERHIDSLSGGEKQRVIIARALAQKTPVLLLDEPTAFLDIRHQDSLHRLLAKKSLEEELTVVAAMHDLNLASAFCSRIVMLKEGEIAADGPPGDVLTAETIGRVFDAEVSVGLDSRTGNTYVIPLNRD